MRYPELVCLVGESPMPVYLGIAQFAAQSATVVLVCSTETEKIAGRIQDLFGKTRPDLTFPKFEILISPYLPRKVRDHLANLVKQYPNAALSYTGGTKVMSSFSILPWLIRKGEDGHLKEFNAPAFYLEEESGQFHFSNLAEPISLDVSLGPDLRGIQTLHDIDDSLPPGSPIDVNFEDLKAIFRLLADNAVQITVPKRLKLPRSNADGKPQTAEQAKKREQAEADIREQAQSGRNAVLEVMTPATREKWNDVPWPESNNAYEKSAIKKQLRYLHGKWLEDFVEGILRRIQPDWSLQCREGYPDSTLFHPNQIAAGQNMKVNEEQFELDVVVCYLHRFFLFSMTTDSDLCKSKMFEAYHRARQVGGVLACSAVVCMAEEDVVKKSFASLGSNDRNRIFGKEALEGWLNGEEWALMELREFLEQKKDLR